MANIVAMENVGKSFAASEIQKFYADKTIFLTGATGFMGKCLVEKLLRGCPDIKKIYVMVREKKGISPEDRIKEYFKEALFDKLRETTIDFESKVHLVKGDLTHDNMALSEEDKKALIDEVNIIFHNASNVKFKERMSTALQINVMGTQAALDLAKQCKHIEGFMYVSTAFSHCYQNNIMEEAYPSPADMKTVQDLIATDLASPTGLDNAALPNVLGKFPNTYCFTKAIAEGLVNDAGKQVSFPCIVYRPSIVLPSWKEPVRNWCGNINGPGMLIMGYGLGLIHAAWLKDNRMDLIPVDMSINAILVAMWDAAKARPSVSGALVYNYGSSVEKPTSIKRFHKMCVECLRKNPSSRIIWKDFIYFTSCFWYFAILHILLHLIPAIFLDAGLLVSGKKTKALAMFKKVTRSFSVLSYFMNGEWKIDISEMNKAIDRMRAIDRELFFCDVRKLDWQDYCSTYWNGVRLYILKDPPSTLPAARRKLRFKQILHVVTKYTIKLLIVYAIARLFGVL